ncbi:hypothetical protein IG631_15673 [Alternaria alternata]|nr:hypothetical protein IG631_15673 [Alternaria alternata]
MGGALHATRHMQLHKTLQRRYAPRSRGGMHCKGSNPPRPPEISSAPPRPSCRALTPQTPARHSVFNHFAYNVNHHGAQEKGNTSNWPASDLCRRVQEDPRLGTYHNLLRLVCNSDAPAFSYRVAMAPRSTRRHLHLASSFLLCNLDRLIYATPNWRNLPMSGFLRFCQRRVVNPS